MNDERQFPPLQSLAQEALAALASANREFASRYPGPSPDRQPVHTVYGGAHLYKATTAARLGELALAALERYGADPVQFATGVGFVPPGSLEGLRAEDIAERFVSDPEGLRRERAPAWLAAAVFARVVGKLKTEPVEDFRIDFEDGFGARPDEEEDAVARAVAAQVAQGFAEGTLTPFLGIRIKPMNEEWATRSARTLGIFFEALLAQTGNRVPEGFVVTLPKVQIAEQPATLVTLFQQLEQRHGLPEKTLRMELMVELTQTLLGPSGKSPLPALLDACGGRCFGAHLGTYDFTASCDITAAYQAMRHPLCDLAKGMMTLAYGGTGIFLSDGATNVMPVPIHRGAELTAAQQAENTAAVHQAWHLAHENTRHSLEGGYYQGWDLHPAQLPARYATTYAFFLEGFAPAAERLRNFVEKAAQATLVGDIFDDAATGQGLLNYFVRALNCGAISEADLDRTGLSREEYRLRSFAKILAARRARLAR